MLLKKQIAGNLAEKGGKMAKFIIFSITTLFLLSSCIVQDDDDDNDTASDTDADIDTDTGGDADFDSDTGADVYYDSVEVCAVEMTFSFAEQEAFWVVFENKNDATALVSIENANGQNVVENCLWPISTAPYFGEDEQALYFKEGDVLTITVQLGEGDLLQWTCWDFLDDLFDIFPICEVSEFS